MNNYIQLKNILGQTNKTVAIISHVNPDGDTVGSAIALKLFLEQFGTQVQLYCQDKIPNVLQFLNGADSYIEECTFFYDIAISVDCSDIYRLGKFSDVYTNSKIRINIDHHMSNILEAEISFVDKEAAATAEIIYHIIKSIDKNKLNSDIAEALYTGITTDTGNFSFLNTTSNTHKIAGELLNYEINVYELTNKLFRTHSLARTRLLADVLSKLEMHHDNKVSVLTVTEEALKKTNAKYEDVEGIIDFGREISGVELSALLKELPNGEGIKISLRSKKSIDVCEIAKKFGGGGHKFAAGYQTKDNLETAKYKIISLLSTELEEVR